jgi:hypothetical protein
MTISSVMSSFDDYFLRARVYPGLITILPVGIFTSLLLPTVPTKLIAPLIFSAGGAFLLGNVARSAGKRLEVRLLKKWCEFPTTHMLRHSAMQQNRILFERRRAAIERVTQIVLPTAAEESANRAASDEAYAAAVRILIVRVRDKKDDFPRVHEENVSYGYRRNLVGLKGLAIFILLAMIGGDVAIDHTRGPSSIVYASFAINITLIGFWLIYANHKWVEQAGISYAERLFECLEHL